MADKWKVTEQEYMQGKEYPTETHRLNALELLRKVNKVRDKYGKPMVVSSGYRDPLHNAEIGGAKKSLHMECKAIDIRDSNGELSAWILNNIAFIEALGLYVENPAFTRGWVHLDTKDRRNVVFNP